MTKRFVQPIIKLLFLLSFIAATACSNFEIKESEMANTFTFDIPGGPVQLTGNNIVINTTATRDNATELAVLLRIEAPNIPGFPSEGKIERIQVDASGNATFEIHALLDIPFYLQFDSIQNLQIIKRPQMRANVALYFGHEWVDTTTGELEEDWFNAAGSLEVIKGGLSKMEQIHLTQDSVTFYEKYIEGRHFLTKCVNESGYVEFWVNKHTDPVKLWFSFDDQYNLATTLLLIDYTDGSQTVKRIDLSTDGDRAMIEMNTHVVIDSNKLAYKTVSGYTIQLWGGQSVIVHCMNRYFEEQHQLYFENSFGCVEVMHTYGRISESVAPTGEDFARESLVPSMYAPDMHTSRRTIPRKFVLNSGHKNKLERQWICELLASPRVWLKSPRFKNYFVPVVVSTSERTIDVSTNDLQSIDIEFTVAFNDKFTNTY